MPEIPQYTSRQELPGHAGGVRARQMGGGTRIPVEAGTIGKEEEAHAYQRMAELTQHSASVITRGMRIEAEAEHRVGLAQINELALQSATLSRTANIVGQTTQLISQLSNLAANEAAKIQAQEEAAYVIKTHVEGRDLSTRLREETAALRGADAVGSAETAQRTFAEWGERAAAGAPSEEVGLKITEWVSIRGTTLAGTVIEHERKEAQGEAIRSLDNNKAQNVQACYDNPFEALTYLENTQANNLTSYEVGFLTEQEWKARDAEAQHTHLWAAGKRILHDNPDALLEAIETDTSPWMNPDGTPISLREVMDPKDLVDLHELATTRVKALAAKEAATESAQLRKIKAAETAAEKALKKRQEEVATTLAVGIAMGEMDEATVLSSLQDRQITRPQFNDLRRMLKTSGVTTTNPESYLSLYNMIALKEEDQSVLMAAITNAPDISLADKKILFTKLQTFYAEGDISNDPAYKQAVTSIKTEMTTQESWFAIDPDENWRINQALVYFDSLVREGVDFGEAQAKALRRWADPKESLSRLPNARFGSRASLKTVDDVWDIRVVTKAAEDEGHITKKEAQAQYDLLDEYERLLQKREDKIKAVELLGDRK